MSISSNLEILCEGCCLPLTKDEVAHTLKPAMCDHCDKSRCGWCGGWVAPRDKVPGGIVHYHKKCVEEMEGPAGKWD